MLIQLSDPARLEGAKVVGRRADMLGSVQAVHLARRGSARNEPP